MMQSNQTNTNTPAQSGEPLSANQLAEVRTDLATDRTVMAADRSLMAWVRTGLSMISFGFTIYKLLEGFQESGKIHPDGLSPKNTGLLLIALGSLSIITGTIEYWQRIGGLSGGQRISRITPSFVMALIWSALGITAFVGILARVL
jgi:putative membrane protein